MDHIQELYRDRNKVSKDLFRRAFDGGLTDAFPFVVNNANYFVFGEEPELIPDGYFQDPEGCTADRLGSSGITMSWSTTIMFPI